MGGKVLPVRLWGKLTVTVFAAVLAAGCARSPWKSDQVGSPQAGPGSALAGKAGVNQGAKPSADQGKPAEPEPARPAEVTVYFANASAEKLVPVKRQVKPDQSPLTAALEALIAGPAEGEGLGAVIPKGTKLRSFNVNQGVAHVNFSQELLANHPGGSAAELMTLYAIASTITQFPEVKLVRLYLEAIPLKAFKHVDLSQGLTPRPELIQNP